MSLDPGDFGPVTINKAITIYGNAAGGAGMITSPGTSGIVISAGANDVINLRGLDASMASMRPAPPASCSQAARA